MFGKFLTEKLICYMFFWDILTCNVLQMLPSQSFGTSFLIFTKTRYEVVA